MPGSLAKLEDTALRSGNKWRKIESILCLGYAQTKSAIDILKKPFAVKTKM
jgi:hypothetical protein